MLAKFQFDNKERFSQCFENRFRNMKTYSPAPPLRQRARSLAFVGLLLLPPATQAQTTYSWIRSATSSANWGQRGTEESPNFSPYPPNNNGPGASDNLIIASVAPLNLGGAREITHLSSIINGGAIGAGSAGASSLTVHGNIVVDTPGATLSLRAGSGTNTTVVTTGGNIDVLQGTLFLGTDTGGTRLTGMSVAGTTTVGGTLNNHRLNASNISLGSLDILSGGIVTLNFSAGTSSGDFSTLVEARSLSGSGTIEASDMTGSGSRSATLDLSSITAESGIFSGTLRDGGSGNTLHVTIGNGIRQTLTGVHSYTGATTLSGGMLELSDHASIQSTSSIAITDGGTLMQNSKVALSAPITLTSGTIGGSGIIVADLAIGSGHTLSPGDGPGSQTFDGNQQWLAGGNYNWQVLNASGTAGVDYDTLVVTGQLSLDALKDDSPFSLNVWSLSDTDTSGDAAGFDPAHSFSWLIATAALISYDSDFDLNSLFSINLQAINGTGGFLNASSGDWSVSLNDDQTHLYLNYIAPIPEPQTYVLLGGIVLLGVFFRKCRKGSPLT